MSARGSRLIGVRPREAAEKWIGAGKELAPPSSKAETYTARLTIDVTPVLRGRIKVAAFEQGVTVADMLRTLLEERFGAVSPGSREADR
jgi:hypothetical protein